MITLRQPLAFSEIGEKTNQEDYIYPSEPTDSDRVFILCDGMGGHERGEVASATVAESMGAMLNGFTAHNQPINAERFNQALTAGYDALENIPGADSERRPGTTLTCLCFNSSTYLAAHMGDSRIYQIRPSLFDAESGELGIIYRSRDHSLVNDLVRAGQITEEMARVHPRRNVITRAMQPRLERRFAAGVHESSEIRPGDYFFLCSDGVLERVTDTTLCEILATPGLTDIEKMEAIRTTCDEGTRDNYSAMLIPVDDITAALPAKRRNGYLWPLLILCAIILVAAAGIAAYYMGYFGQSQPEETVIDTLVEEPATVPDTIVTTFEADTAATPAPAAPAAEEPVAEPQKPDTAKAAKPHTPADTREQKPAAEQAKPEAEKPAQEPAKEAAKETKAPEQPAKNAVPEKKQPREKGSVPPPPAKKDNKPQPLAP